MSKSRLKMASKNVVWAYINMLITTILKFVVRCVFIQTIGATMLGINGLYTSILNVLSLTELGIGTAVGYSLYKPVAEGDKEAIKSLMGFYKNAYQFIALVVSVLGISVIPFLKYIVKGAENVDHLTLYYVLFLVNTVSSYFVSYKYSLNNAEQKGYIIRNIESITNVVICSCQIVALYLFKSFLLFLIVQIALQLVSKIFTAFYLNHEYPFLLEKNVIPLDKDKKKKLFTNVKALLVHKFGDIAVNQTDNIIISAFISVTVTGIVSNYVLIISSISGIIGVVFSNIIGSLGNLCATEAKEKQYQIFRVCDMLSFLFFGFSAIAFACLIQPFVKLLWGEEYLIDTRVVMLLILNFYCVGKRTALSALKLASGVFVQDRFLPFAQASVNLVSSVILAKYYGLIGVFLGTIISGVIPTFVRPYLIFEIMFERTSMCYFRAFTMHFVYTLLVGLFTYFCCHALIGNPTWGSFVLGMGVVAFCSPVLLWLFVRKTPEYAYLCNAVSGGLLKRGKKWDENKNGRWI